jgi:alanine-synthesizing transaminase
VPKDKRFVYYLMGSTGLTLVPLSGMNSDLDGFRVTLLEPDIETFTTMLTTLVTNVRTYLAS